MSLLPPSLLQKLGRTRLQVQRAPASTGVGERRSKALGSGMEFADHRPYQFGDDIRHLDPHLHARLGRHYIRQYSTSQQLSVTILLDASRSMAYGDPPKFDFGRALAAGLAYAGLVGGDQVLVGVFADGGIRWHARIQGAMRTASLCSWLEGLHADGVTDLEQVVRSALPRIARVEGLTILISDWFVEGIPEALATLESAGQEVVAVHLLSPEEIEPERLGTGEVRFMDAELGNEMEMFLGRGLHQRYREELEAWSAELRAGVLAHRGRYLAARSDDDLELLLVRDWRLEGLLG
ncbi:MAG: DUF58 domain-containing protein [Gemmatimonadetes bacterium]|nr:DUF58 domain-containing protein [Gemmatimonadota bacterium]